jgi:hypothetical protein
MAIIYSYPAINEIASSDLMLISDASKNNATKSTSISQLTSYISGLIGTGDVSSVNTQTGIVVLDTDDIAQGTTNLYMTFGTTSTTALVGTTFNSVTNDSQGGYVPYKASVGGFVSSKIYQSTVSGQMGINTKFLDVNYGLEPDLRVAGVNPSGAINPGVLDLFRTDDTVDAGEVAGRLQYSVKDDGRYAIAAIDAVTLQASGTGNSGGGKLVFLTSEAALGAGPVERMSLDNTGLTVEDGVILKSPNGTKYKIVVDNSGVLSTTLIP